MDLAIEVMRPDPWHLAALRRLEARDPDGAAEYRRGGRGEEWQAQAAAEFAISLEQVLQMWERMEPGRGGCPPLQGRDAASAAEWRRRHQYLPIFARFRWARVTSSKGGVFLVAGTRSASIQRIVWLMRGKPEPLCALEAFDEAVKQGAVWWAF